MTLPIGSSRGRHVRDEPGGGRPAWLLPVLVLAGLLLVGVLLLALTGGDDEDATDPQAGESSAPTEEGAPAAPGGDAGDEAAAQPEPEAPVGVDPDAGALSAGETPVFPLSDPGQDLTAYLEVPVQAPAAPVESVVGGQGFWLGPSPQERIFVRLMPAEGLEQPLQPGSVVQFDGARFVPHDQGFAAGVGVGPEAGAEQLTAQRAHVEVPAEAVRVVS